MTHVMLDLETLGTMPGCVVLSVGACTFDPHDDPQAPWIGRSFNLNIERSSCEGHGLTAEPDTLAWWERQSEEARARLLTEPYSLFVVATEFHAWWRRVGGVYLWCNGAAFDEPIWRVAAEKVHSTVPWKYWNVRDTRTVWDIGKVNPRNIARDGVAHSAYADARHQAKCVTLAYANLKRMQPYLFPPVSIRGPVPAGPEVA